jgi:hypothetical protein
MADQERGSRSLRLIRVILAILIACSVGMAPVRAGFAGAPGADTPARHMGAHEPGEAGAAAHRHFFPQNAQEVTRVAPPSAHEPAAACCDEAGQAEGPASHPAAGDCGAMPGCVLKCFSVVPWSPMLVSVPLTGSRRLAWQASDVGVPAPAARPFHPPRS